MAPAKPHGRPKFDSAVAQGHTVFADTFREASSGYELALVTTDRSGILARI